MRKLFRDIADGTRFHFEGDPYPHFIKRGPMLADVVGSHRTHSKAPPVGFYDNISPMRPVMTFDDLPLAEKMRRGLLDIRLGILELARRFPCLRDYYPDGVEWDADELDRIALKFSSGEVAAARFVLALWNPRVQWRCGKFVFIDAISSLDAAHRLPIAEWVMDPWWP
jgi:hypothetical protein